jgi:hypothetical protein
MSAPGRGTRAIVAAAALIAIWNVVSSARDRSARQQSSSPTAAVQSASGSEEAQTRVTCGGCHRMPPPEILPRDAWRDEIVRMMFIRDNRVPPIGPPGMAFKNVQLAADMQLALDYYAARAPERLPAPDPWPAPSESPVPFDRRGLAVRDMPGPPAVSNVNLVDMDGDGRLDLLGTDMRQSVVFAARPAATETALSVVASIPHPAHVAITDVDRDGTADLLVADMGGFFPEDHNKGSVIWLRGQANGKYGAFWLDGWPRVAGVAAADYNGDGKLDIGAAAFGWRKTGHLAILENRTKTPTQPDFATHIIEPKPGAIQFVPVDLNRDGRMDVVTLLAQEHETVLAFINRGTGAFDFDRQVIYAAPHPNWGSSGIQVGDLDKDGDLDVVLAHGDTFDDGIVKPYHGIQWLENRGGFPFVDRPLATMPGVHAAKLADLDADGDLDIVAAALLAGGADVDERTLPALVWLEQTKPGTFARHTIEMGFPRHATLDVGDLDADGDPDIVVGNFSLGAPAASWVDVWTNQLKKR